MPASSAESRAGVNTSARHSFDVLRLVARSPEPMGVTELARALDLAPSTVHRILVTLEDSEYIERHPRDSRVTLGVAAHELLHALFNQFPLRKTAFPYLERLAGSAGETAGLQVCLGRYSVRVAGIEGAGTIHRALHLGEAFPLHVTAGGRAILAFLSDDVQRGYLNAGWITSVPAGLDPRTVDEELRAVRKRGYALDLANLYPESRSIAFPVQGPNGVIASISLAGSAGQFDPEADTALLDGWRQIVQELESSLAESPETSHDPLGHLPPESIDLDVVLPQDTAVS